MCSVVTPYPFLLSNNIFRAHLFAMCSAVRRARHKSLAWKYQRETKGFYCGAFKLVLVLCSTSKAQSRTQMAQMADDPMMHRNLLVYMLMYCL